MDFKSIVRTVVRVFSSKATAPLLYCIKSVIFLLMGVKSQLFIGWTRSMINMSSSLHHQLGAVKIFFCKKRLFEVSESTLLKFNALFSNYLVCRGVILGLGAVEFFFFFHTRFSGFSGVPYANKTYFLGITLFLEV